jgi:hypothetical protein
MMSESTTSRTGVRERAVAMRPKDFAATGLPARAVLIVAWLSLDSRAKSVDRPAPTGHLLAKAPRVNDHAHRSTSEHKPALPPEPYPTSRTGHIASRLLLTRSLRRVEP